MDFIGLLDKRQECIADAPPPCAGACPLGIDVRDFIRKIRTGLYSAAYKTFTRFAVLPGVVCHICEEPCQNACVRAELDQAISLRQLERFCWQQSRGKPAASYYSPPKKERILVIGGGMSGMACAVKLAERRYQVELVEKSNRLGGRLWDIDEAILPKAVLEEELTRVSRTKHLKVTLNKPLAPPETYELAGEFDAVLVATGANPDGVVQKTADQGIHRKDRVFYAGSLVCPGQSPLASVYQGASISYLIEEYLKIGRVVTSQEKRISFLYKPDLRHLEPVAKPAVPDGQGWTADDVKFEAQRCLLCSCANCSDVCMLMQHYHKEFKKLASDIADTVVSTRIEEKKTALYPIMSCTQCGSCKLSCPVNIDTKSLCLESRRVLHQRGQLPDAHYEYWLNDMRHANSGEAALFIPAGGKSRARYVYFPGCQMGASKPAYVTQSYAWLARTFPDQVALILYCCGAPALWAGDAEIHREVVAAIRNQWRAWGEPAFVLSCPTCAQMFRDHLPEIETVFLWELLVEHFPPSREVKGTVAVFDPCSSQGDTQTQKSIRALIVQAGYEIAELAKREDEALCCGYGGLIYTTNPGLFKRIGERNKGLSPYELITYCTNCRDNFLVNDKAARHILDLLFENSQDAWPTGPCSGQVPGLTERRTNRMAVKKRLMKEILKVDYMEPVKTYDRIKLMLTPEIKAKMDAQLILEDNIKQVIDYAETTGKMLYFEETDWVMAHRQQGNLTFWVKYRPEKDGYAIGNVYFHRLCIVEG